MGIERREGETLSVWMKVDAVHGGAGGEELFAPGEMLLNLQEVLVVGQFELTIF